MDLAAAKIAYDIKWQKPELFSDVIVNLGAFHIMCSYLGALGKMMAGSGFEDVLIEAGLCASGSIAKVMSGKHYNRAMRVHQLVMESMERLLVQAFIDKEQLDSPDTDSAADLTRPPAHEVVSQLTNAVCCYSTKSLWCFIGRWFLSGG
jgi:hypothetical protein